MPDGDGNANGDGNSAGISQAALQAAIEKARLEERTKLRDEIDRAKASANEAQTRLAELQTTNSNLSKEVGELKSKIDTLTKSTENGNVNVEKIIAETAAATRASIEKEYGAKLSALQTDLDTERKARAEASIRAHTDSVVRKYASEAGVSEPLVRELVRGSTEAEIDESAKRAVDLLKANLPAGSQSQNNNDGRGTQGNLPPNASASGGGGNQGGGDPLTKVREMTMEEYGKQREKILKEAAGRYPKSFIS